MQQDARYARNYPSAFVGDGDSITAASVDTTHNIFADSWYTYLTANSDGRIPYRRNVAKGGYTSAQLLALLDTDVLANMPAGGNVIWAAGRNDSQTLSLVQSADRDVLRRCRAAGVDVTFTTIPPVGTTALDAPAAPTGVADAASGTLAAGTYAYTVVAKNAHG